MERRPTHVVDVTGPQTLLTSRRSREIEFDLAEKVILELIHAGGREQYRWIPSGHQNITGATRAAFRFKEGQVFFAEFVSFHGRWGEGEGRGIRFARAVRRSKKL